MTAAAKIKEVLERYGETYDARKGGTVWEVQGTPVISHKCLERVAAKAGIAFEKPTILRAERDEAVIMVAGSLDKRSEWSIGEALVNVNYRVSGKQAAYVYAMAEKRGKDRVILKLVELHGLAYSEEEADEFKKAGRQQDDTVDPDVAANEFIASCKKRIADAPDTATLAGWWNTDERRQAFRDFDLNDDECRELQQLVTARVEALKPRAVS
ncbi:trna delta -isopentenylpyrophosphate transferase [Methylobacterium sp. P1-11]|uniref:trna delta -isopentenylpyrophosphate transferase n=1 Tax=Methylobacterium sp. P1-11 TaxID=2024616 RepID=UPI001FEF40A3|nr:trna delta -isopentenylpyrophosphate transferase [Methylobacterium sp. P1-11]